MTLPEWPVITTSCQQHNTVGFQVVSAVNANQQPARGCQRQKGQDEGTPVYTGPTHQRGQKVWGPINDGLLFQQQPSILRQETHRTSGRRWDPRGGCDAGAVRPHSGQCHREGEKPCNMLHKIVGGGLSRGLAQLLTRFSTLGLLRPTPRPVVAAAVDWADHSSMRKITKRLSVWTVVKGGG